MTVSTAQLWIYSEITKIATKISVKEHFNRLTLFIKFKGEEEAQSVVKRHVYFSEGPSNSLTTQTEYFS